MALEHVSPGDPHAVSHNEERDAINALAVEGNKPSRQSDRAYFYMHKALLAGDCTIVAMGDSKTEGTGLKTTTERWLYKLQENLRAQYGETDKGYGYIPAKYGTFYDFDDKPTTIGTVTGYTQGWGLGTRSLTMDAGGSVTFPILPYTANTPLVVHWTRKSGGGEFEVVVGGVVHATIATAGGAMSMQTEVALPAGDHAVQLRTKGSVAVSIEGIFNRTAVEGVRVIDGSLSGGTFKNFGQDLVGNGHWSAAAHYGIDGVVMAFGANDMSGRTPAEMVTDAESAVAKAKVAAPNAGIVILMGTERTQDAGTGKVREYEAAMRSAFAEESNVSVLYESDLWVPTAGVDYTWGGPDGWLVDTVHTSAAAHTEIAKYIGKPINLVRTKPLTSADIGAATIVDSKIYGLLDYSVTDNAPPSQPPPVTILSDDFNRTLPELHGTSPQIGNTWVASPGKWSSDGENASASGSGALRSDIGRSEATLSVNLRVVTAAVGAQLFRVYLGADTTTPQNGVWASLSVNTSGYFTAAIWKTINGTNNSVISCPHELTGNLTTTQDLTLTFSLEGTTVSLDCGVGAVTAELTEEEVASLSTEVNLYAASAMQDAYNIDRVSATVPGEPIDPTAPNKIVTVTEDGVLPASVIEVLDTHYDARYVVDDGETNVEIESAAEPLRAQKVFGSGDVTVAVVSDSTANDGNDWLRLFALKWGALLPEHVRRTYRNWNTATDAWNNTITDNAGAEPDLGAIIDDDFSTVGEVVGSTPDNGPAWSGTAEGGWTSDGTLVTTKSFATIGQDLGSKDQTVRLDLSLVTGGKPSSQLFRLYLGSNGYGGGSGFWASFSINTSGIASITLYKTIGEVTTALSSATTLPSVINNTNTPQAITVEASTSIQNVTVKVTGPDGQAITLTAVIPEAEVESLGTWVSIYGAHKSTEFDYGYRLTGVHMHTPASTNPTEPPTLSVHNGSIAGGKLTVQFTQPNLDVMFAGIVPDVLIFGIGHNNGAQSGSAFTSEVSAWVSAWHKRYPDCAVLVTTQNPQVTPAAGIVAHRDRQAALRGWVKRQGYDYIPAFEAFIAKPDGGASYVGPDGVHPSTPPGGTTVGDYGSILWADTAIKTLDDE